MATIAEPPLTTASAPGKYDRPRGSLRFDWLMLLVGMWPLVGALTDANAHINDPQLETFFTPWHALLYSGVLAVGLCIGYVAWRNHQRGYAWTRAVPPGYGLTLVGVGILGVAGIGDLIWHSLYRHRARHPRHHQPDAHAHHPGHSARRRRTLALGVYAPGGGGARPGATADDSLRPPHVHDDHAAAAVPAPILVPLRPVRQCRSLRQ